MRIASRWIQIKRFISARTQQQVLRTDGTYNAGDILPASGDGEIRTLDPLLARQVLSQLSYAPGVTLFMGLSGLEPPTSRLSGVRSNRLSYKPRFNEQVHMSIWKCFGSLLTQALSDAHV